MKHKKKLQSFSTALFAAVLLLSTTSCDNNNEIIDEYEVISPAEPSEGSTIEKVTYPTAMLGNFGEIESELRNSFTNIVDPEVAKILIVDGGSVEEYSEVLSDIYTKGGLIVVFNPTGSSVADWSDRNGIFYAGPDTDEKWTIYGFNNAGTYYSLQDNDDIDDEDVPLFHFCNWVNTVAGNRFKGVDLRTKDIRKRFAPQRITHTFKISVDEQQLIDQHWATQNQLSLSTTANASYTIYPLHVFDSNAQGDYYAIEAEIVIHNAPMDNGRWLRRRGNEMAQICGFYLSSCDITTNLLRKSNGNITDSYTHVFAEGANPQPGYVSNAETYEPGFEWTIDATVAGGIPDSKDNHMFTASNNWTWDNTSRESLPGVEIQTHANTDNVFYTLLLNSLPSETDDLSVTAIPDIASGDLKFCYSWIWKIGDVTEDSNDKFYMQVGLEPLYRAYQWTTGVQKMTIGEFGNSSSKKSVYMLPLTPPNRVPTCSTVIRNTSEESYYISDIKLWRNKGTDKEAEYVVPQTICTTTATGGSGVSATMLMLPVGEYTVEGIRYSMGNDERVNVQTIVSKEPITLTMAGNVTIDFGSKNFIVK